MPARPIRLAHCRTDLRYDRPRARWRSPGERAVSIAATLPARDPTAIVPINRSSYHPAAPSRTDGDTTWPDANPGIGVTPATVPVITVVAVAVAPDLNIELGVG